MTPQLATDVSKVAAGENNVAHGQDRANDVIWVGTPLSGKSAASIDRAYALARLAAELSKRTANVKGRAAEGKGEDHVVRPWIPSVDYAPREDVREVGSRQPTNARKL